MSSQRFDEVEERVWTHWDLKKNKFQCCDCSLVHIMEFRIVPNKMGKGNKIEFRCWRDNPATNRLRKRHNIHIERKSHAN